LAEHDTLPLRSSSMKVALVLTFCALFAEGARIEEHTQNVAGWGRTCESLQARFTQQGTNLRKVEGSKAMIGSISMMRTLRRANARECTWIQNGDVDVSALSELAGSYLQKSPCYEQSRSALQSAQDLPAEQRDAALLNGLALLFSENEDCSPDNAAPADVGDEPDDVQEEDIDDTTDQLMELAVSSQDSSLIQQPYLCTGFCLVLAFSRFQWEAAGASALTNPLFLVGLLVFSIITALFCGVVMHAIVRIFRWIRCSLTGGSCEEYAPATWLKAIVTGGCSIYGLVLGPFHSFAAEVGLVNLLRR